MPSYFRPGALDEALHALATHPRTILAGGTDFYPARVGRLPSEDILDITAISGLRKIEDCGRHYRIGALTTWTDIIRQDLPAWFRALKLAAREVGGIQVQNAGTVVGNVCNASPAADGVPCLLALDTSVILGSVEGEREVPLSGFIVGNRKTIRRADELVVGLKVPKPAANSRSGFLKLGARSYLVISIVMTAMVVELTADETVERIRISVGSCSEVAYRLKNLERQMIGKPFRADLVQLITRSHFDELSPIDDVRGTTEYRLDASFNLVRRLMGELISGELS